MLATTLLGAVALLAAQVAAHGAVTSYIIGGVKYPGYEGFSPQYGPPTIQRQWPSYNPILSVSSPSMTCNGGTSAPLSAPVKAGDNVTAVWKQWTHQQGPLMVWMYKCPGAFGTCTGSGAGWFKIDQVGMTAPPLAGTHWGVALVMAALKWTSTIPAKLAPGNYLIRHELLALHQPGTPQFYPECAQLVVSGTGTALPGPSYLTSIPSYASSKDPAITVNVYSSSATTYTPPGPPVWT